MDGLLQALISPAAEICYFSWNIKKQTGLFEREGNKG